MASAGDRAGGTGRDCLRTTLGWFAGPTSAGGVRLLVDHNISPYIARALAAIGEPDGHEVKAKSELFRISDLVLDTEWLGVLAGQSGWAFVTMAHAL